ncbi:SICAvar, type I (fragment), partial [Plasmodium knowlesi strain H]
MSGTSSEGLLKGWMEHWKSTNGVTTGQAPEAKAEQIATTLKDNLETAFSTLDSWLAERSESNEIRNLCGKGKEDGGKFWRGSGVEPEYRKILCEAILEIKYFMNGVETKKAGKGTSPQDETPFVTPLTPEKAYARCIVGMLALSEIYGDHCKLDEVIERVQDKVSAGIQQKLNAYLVPNYRTNLDICKKITNTDLIVGRSLLHDKIKGWTDGKRAQGNRAIGWRIKMPWQYWQSVCNKNKKPEQDDPKLNKLRQQNAESMATFMNLNDTKSNTNDVSLSDILVKDEYKLPESTLKRIVRSAVSDDSGTPGASPLNMENLKQELNKEVQTQK